MWTLSVGIRLYTTPISRFLLMRIHEPFVRLWNFRRIVQVEVRDGERSVSITLRPLPPRTITDYVTCVQHAFQSDDFISIDGVLIPKEELYGKN